MKFCTYTIRFLVSTCLLFVILAPSAHAVLDMDITSQSAYLVDAVTDTVLYEKNADQQMYPAGLTKIMTAILVLENATLDETVTISQAALDHGSASGGTLKLKAGEQMSIEDLLYCLLLISSNEAAYALAEHIGQDESTFVTMMNDKAVQLGAQNTHFSNTSGLHKEDHYTTAKDMYKIVAYAIQNAAFMEISNSVERRISPTNLNDKGYTFYTDNHLISKFKSKDYMYSHARGVIGGYTSTAGYCLASTAIASRDGMHLVGVTMGGVREDKNAKIPSFDDMATLFQAAFDEYAITQILRDGELLGEADIALGKTRDFISVSAGENISVLMPKNIDLTKIEKVLHFNENISAPITKGDIMGTLSIIYEGETYATSSLYANFDVEKSQFLHFIQSISSFLTSGVVGIGVILVVILVVVYVIMTIISNRRRQMLLRGKNYKKRKRL